MRFRQISGWVMAGLLVLWANAAMAAGGFYLEGGRGFAEIDHNDTAFDTDSKARNFSTGFTVAPNAFSTSSHPSYILRVGYDRLELQDQYDVTIDSHGLRIDNTFGWPLLKNNAVRMTLGPIFRVGYYWGKSDGAIGGTTAKTRAGSFGFGPELATNVKLNDDLGLGLAVGYVFNYFAGEIEDGNFRDDYTGHRYNGYATVALLFH
jgi:hypothetical protein